MEKFWGVGVCHLLFSQKKSKRKNHGMLLLFFPSFCCFWWKIFKNLATTKTKTNRGWRRSGGFIVGVFATFRKKPGKSCPKTKYMMRNLNCSLVFVLRVLFKELHQYFSSLQPSPSQLISTCVITISVFWTWKSRSRFSTIMLPPPGGGEVSTIGNLQERLVVVSLEGRGATLCNALPRGWWTAGRKEGPDFRGRKA